MKTTIMKKNPISKRNQKMNLLKYAYLIRMIVRMPLFWFWKPLTKEILTNS